jgi:hypothetical protein
MLIEPTESETLQELDRSDLANHPVYVLTNVI